MYPGGTGGEFLSQQISSHCSAFRELPTQKCTFNSEVNRTIIRLPTFFNALHMATPTESSDLALCNNIKNFHLHVNEDINKSVIEADEFLNSHELPALVRVHESISDVYTKANTTKIQITTVEEKVYALICLYIKLSSEKLTESRLLHWARICESRLAENKPTVDIVKKIMLPLIGINKNCTLVHCFFLFDVVKQGKYTVSELTNVASKPLRDLIIEQISSMSKFNIPASQTPRNIEKAACVPFFDLFKENTLRNLYNLPDDTVRSNLIQWHLKNVELFALNGFAITSGPI